jgi:enoyl-[acyl-carrier protein] reductase II
LKAGAISREDAMRKLEEFWIGALRRAVVDGDVERGSLMAGQSVAFVKKVQPVREIIEELVAGAENALARVAGEA